MSGRGYLKKRLAEMKLKAEGDKSMNQQNVNGTNHMYEHLNSSISNGVNVHAPKAQSMINLQKQLSHFVAPKENSVLHQTNTVPPVCNGFHKSPTQPLPQSMVNHQQTITSETPIEENNPVICRVPPISAKNNYKITQLESNYLKIEQKDNIGMYEYHVDFNPPIDARHARFYLINQHKEIFPVRIFDGTILCIPTMLENNVTVLVSKLKDDSEVTITITFKYKKKLGDSVYFYNILLREVMKKLGFIEFGKSFYDPDKKSTLYSKTSKLEIWSGYVTVINEFENGLYLCCDVSHRVLRVETVLESVNAILSKSVDKDFKKVVLSSLINSTVITRYNKKTYSVDDIDFLMTPLSKFKYQDTEISYVDYYKKMYNIEIKNLTQYLIISKPKKRNLFNSKSQDSVICCLIPELCSLTGLTQDLKDDSKMMSELRDHTKLTPEVRQRALIDLVKRIHDSKDASQILNNWGLTLHQIPVKLEGPVYAREKIIMGNNQHFIVPEKMDWGAEIVKNAVFTAAKLVDWAIFYLPKETSTVKTFCKQLIECVNPMGIVIKQPMHITIQTKSAEAYVSKVYDIVKNNSNLQLVVIIFPNTREDLYNAIKRLCCAEIGIPSQVILSRTLDRKLRSVTQKIALQINCKLGGACWAISIPLTNTMIVGIDVYHEKNKLMPSITGIVASLDKTFTKWYSVVINQRNTHQELLTSIKVSFHELLKKYKEVNEVLPDRIIIYRDGISDGELNIVNEYELKNIEECFEVYPGNYNPKVTFIIVQKRINTRIYQFIDEQNKYYNPPAGTIIDNTITRRNFFDFFLVSQNCRQGTVNPTHYIVLKNGCNLSTENVQRLTYKLCHMYYNWCGTIKVPCPVQYAHKLAYLIGNNVKRMPHKKLNNTLYYL